MSELVVIQKGGNKQKNTIGAVLADKRHPPFTERRDGYRLRWWGTDHPASERVRALVGAEEPSGDGDGLVDEICFHVDFPDFRCKVLRVDDGRAKVRVVGGWRGPRLPKDAVSVPTAKLEVLS